MHARCVAAAASGFKRRGPVEGSEREGVGKRKRKEKKREREREREREKIKKRKGKGERKSHEASTAQDCEFSTLSEQKNQKKSRPRADASGGERLWLRQSPG
jgi:hypothetical protein